MERQKNAWLLLVVLLSLALPRTLFHHYLEGQRAVTVETGATAVFVDTHCPICDTPIPVCYLQDLLTVSPINLHRMPSATLALPQLARLQEDMRRYRGPPIG